MADSLPYIVDASIVIKWHLKDEEYVEEAETVQDDLVSDRIQALAPGLIRYEVAAAILKATRNPERRERPSTRAGQRAIEIFLAWNIRLVHADILVPAAFRLAAQFGCSYYDGVYLALSEMTGYPYIHADRKLRNARGNRFPLALWIEGYRPA